MSEKSSFIRATRIGSHAWQYLTTQSRKGLVISSFSGGNNLLFEDGEAFVPVQSTDVPLHPWAIEIPGEALRFPEGTPVSADEKELSLGNTQVMLSTAKIEKLSLTSFSADGVANARRNLQILARFVEDARKSRDADPFQPQIDAILARWHESGDPEILLDLIGLGAGSTPSGDDVLIGILAELSILEGGTSKSRGILAQLRTGIQKTVRTRTPLPSAQMLLAASARAFGEPIIDLITGLACPIISEGSLLEKARRVFQLGHHSGHSILLGLLISLRNRTTCRYAY